MGDGEQAQGRDRGDPGTDTAEEELSFRFAVADEGDEPRAAGAWGRYEQSRVREFLKSDPQPIGDGKLGSVGPVAFTLTCKRTASGFEASYSLSIEERIGPNRIERGQATGRWLAIDNSVVLTFPMPQFGRACGTRTLNWSGTLTRDQFDMISGLDTIGDVTVRRC